MFTWRKGRGCRAQIRQHMGQDAAGSRLIGSQLAGINPQGHQPHAPQPGRNSPLPMCQGHFDKGESGSQAIRRALRGFMAGKC